MRKLSKKIIVCCYICCVLMSGILLNYINKEFLTEEKYITEEVVTLFNTGWEIQEGNEIKEIHINSWQRTLPADVNGRIVLGNVLPEIRKEGITLSFYTYHQNVEVIVDDDIVYTYGTKENSKFGKLTGCIINTFVLPQHYSGKKMKIILTNTYDADEAYVPEFYIGTETAQLKNILSQWFLGIGLTGAIAVLGIMQIVQWFAKDKKNRDIGKIYLGICAINLAVWFGCDIPVLSFIFGNSIVTMYLSYLALTVLPIPLSLFIETILGERYEKIFKGIQIVAVINFFVCMYLQVKGIYDLREMLFTTHIIIMTIIVGTLGSYYYERYVLKSRIVMLENEFLKVASGFIIATAVIDIVRFYFVYTSDSTFFIRIGLFVFLLAMSVSINDASLDIEVITKEVEKYEKLAYTDLMTGLYNRAAYEEALLEIKEKINKNKNIGVAAILFDLNDLKLVNDTKGHKVGDFYLSSFATILKGVYGNDGKCYRIGGDEFVAICEGSIVKKYELFGKILDKKIERYNEKSELKMSVAQGFAKYDRLRDKDFEDTVKRADKAMYENKKEMKAGREIR